MLNLLLHGMYIYDIVKELTDKENHETSIPTEGIGHRVSSLLLSPLELFNRMKWVAVIVT